MFVQLRHQFNTFWQRQSSARKIVLVVLLIGAAVLIPVFITWAGTPTYSVAFSGLSEEDAGQIVQKMSEEGVDYQLRDAGTILVASDQVYEVRLRMAREGLPQSGTVGFELFSENTLGMTEFTQRVNYQRALEGELERTIGSMAAVSAVRVHIVTPEKSLLAGDQPPTTASVTVQQKAGRALDSGQVQAITHLLASSVEGLQAENVVVVDTNGNLLATGSSGGESGSTLAQSDSRRTAEMAAAADVQKKVQSLLDSVLGPNRSVVQASVLLDWTQRETTRSSYTPDPTAVRSSSKVNEVYSTDGSVVGGIPGAISNLPTPAATPGVGGTNAGVYSRQEETLNYELNEVQSHEVESPGQLKRVSLSVLVDGVSDQNQLATLRAAVASAAGIDEERGDTLTVETLAFDRTFLETQTAELEKADQTQMYWQIGQAVAVALGVLALMFFLSKMFKNLRVQSKEAWTPVLKPVTEMAGLQAPRQQALPNNRPAALNSHSDSPAALPSIEQLMPEVAARMQAQQVSPEDEQIQRVITRLAEESPANVAEIIQLWLSEDEK